MPVSHWQHFFPIKTDCPVVKNTFKSLMFAQAFCHCIVRSVPVANLRCIQQVVHLIFGLRSVPQSCCLFFIVVPCHRVNTNEHWAVTNRDLRWQHQGVLSLTRLSFLAATLLFFLTCEMKCQMQIQSCSALSRTVLSWDEQCMSHSEML